MKYIKKVLMLALAFVLAIPNMVGIVLSQDITDYSQSYPKDDTGYEQITIGEGIQVPVKLKLRYDGGEAIGVLTDDSTSSSQTCAETNSISKIFDGNDSSGLILRDKTSWDGYVKNGDYIAVEFQNPVNMKRVKFTFNSNKSSDTYNTGTIQYLCNEDGAVWEDLQSFTNSELISAEYNSDIIYNVKAVRLLAGDTSRTRKWVRINEIKVEGTLYEEPATVNKEALSSYITAATRAYVNEVAYTEESFANFKEKYVKAQVILADASATQATVNNMLTALKNSRIALVLNPRDLGTLINENANSNVVVLNCDAENEAATNTLDYNNNTKWHSPWGDNAVFPVSVTYDLGKVYDLTDLSFLPRQDGQYNGDIFKFELYVGETSDNLQLIGVFNIETTGTGAGEQLTNRGEFKRVTYDATGRYVKMKVTRAGSENGSEINTYASMAEIRFYGTEKTEEDDGYVSDVDKTMLGDLIDQADSLIGTDNTAGQYTANSFATYINALNTAIIVYDDDLAIEALVTEVYNILKEAMDNLVDVEVLAMNIEIAKEELTFRTDESDAWKAGYQSMIDELEALLTKGNATQDEIDAAVERLDVIEPYASLYEAIEEAKAIDTSNKTEDSVNALNAAIAEAEAILNNKASTYDEFEMKLVNVQEKVDELVEKAIDKTALLAALEANKATYEANNANQAYTEHSFEVFKAAYDAANAMKDKDAPEIKQVDVEKATQDLIDAYEGLADYYNLLPNKAVEVVEVGDTQSGFPFSNVFDENASTFWYTSENRTDHSTHHFTLKVPVNYYNKLELLPRPQEGNYWNVNGVFKEIKVYAKLGESSEWTLVAHRNDLTADSWQTVELDESVKADYLKVDILEAGSHDGVSQYASLAELKIYHGSDKLKKDGWKAVAYFSNGDNAEYGDNAVDYVNSLGNAEGPAEHMLDGDLSTHFHSDYAHKSETYYANPITIIVKLGKEETFNYVNWLSRLNAEDCRIKKFELYTIEGNQEYTDAELKSGAPWVKKFEMDAENTRNAKFYVGEQTSKYVKIVCTSHNGNHHLTCAELDLYYESKDEAEEIKYTGINALLEREMNNGVNAWIKESAYNQYREVKSYYGIVEGVENKFSSEEANLVKYITSSVLSVKAQSQVVGDVINVRFLTSIASTNLEALRFKIEILNSDGTVNKTGFVNTNRVFGSVVADNVEISNAASVFGNNVSTHFAVCKLNNIPVSLKDNPQQTKIRVTPYWAPVDVTEDDNDNYVKGISRTFTVKELHDNASNTNTMNE